jgi:enediyne biosynthesis protein E4
MSDSKKNAPESRPSGDPGNGDAPLDDAVIGRAFRQSLYVMAALAIVGVGVVIYLKRPVAAPPEIKTELPVSKKRQPPQAVLPEIHFADATAAAGIDFAHENGALGEKLLPESMGGACAFFDYDNDGDQDILFVNSDFWPGQRPTDRAAPTMALYSNAGKGSFVDVTHDAGLALSFYGQGVAVGDFDNDGWVDLFISAVGPNHLFRNNRGKFEEVTRLAGVAGEDDEWSTSCGFFDYDNDNDLDLFVCNYVRWSPTIDRELKCTLDGSFRAYCRPDAFEGAHPYLYRNEGNGKFTDVSAAAGVQVQNANTGVPVGKSLGLAPVDVDSDGWIDLVVANDTVQNFLFHNKQNGTFEEIGAKAGVAFDIEGRARGAMGVDTGYFRNDRTLGIAIGNFANEMSALYCSAGAHAIFSDDAVATGLGPPSRSWLKFGIFFFDADLDGRLDILASNGHLENDIHKVQKSQQYAQPPQLFWNCGTDSSTEFLPVPAEKTGKEFAAPLVGRGSAFADIDGDGDLDVLLTATGGPARLLRNDQALGHHWARLKLVGTKCHRDAIGAIVELRAGGATQTRTVMPTRSYLSQSELPVTFGLGSAEKIEEIRIQWPDGSRQTLRDVPIDQLVMIMQTES